MATAESTALMREGVKFAPDGDGSYIAEHWLPHHEPVLRHIGFKQLSSGTWRRPKTVQPGPDWDPEQLSDDLWEHQKAAVKLAMERTGSGLWLDMGCGKTRCAIEVMARGGHQRILVICPKAVIPVWYEQIERWWNYESEAPEAIKLKGRNTEARAQKLLDRMDEVEMIKLRPDGSREPTPADGVLVINYEVSHLDAMRKAIAAWAPDLIVCDEAHRIKGHNSKASVAVGKMAPHARRRLALSGTPITNALEDAFGIYRFINPSLFGTTWTGFKNRYLIMGGPQNAWPVGYRNEEELKAKLATCSIHVKSEDVQDLPEQQDVIRSFEISAKARKAYKAMEQDALAVIDDSTVEASNVLVRLLRLQQLTSGYARDDQDQIIGPLCKARQDLLAETLGEIPPHEPVVVFYKYSPEIAQIEAAAGMDAFAKKKAPARSTPARYVWQMNGDVKQLDEWKEACEQVDRESGDDVAPVLAVQIDAGGEGVDMTLAAYTIYYSTGFSLSAYEQSRKRTHRPGQQRTCFYYHLSATNTIDQHIRKCLAAKRGTVEDLMGAMRHGDADAALPKPKGQRAASEPTHDAPGDGGDVVVERAPDDTGGSDRGANPQLPPEAADSQRLVHGVGGPEATEPPEDRSQRPTAPSDRGAPEQSRRESPSDGQATDQHERAQTLAQLVREYADVRKQEEDAKAVASELTKRKRSLEFRMVEAREREGVGKSFDAAGVGKVTFADKLDFKANDPDALLAWLDEHDLGDVAKRAVNAQTLGKTMRDLLRDREGFSPPPCVDVSERVQVSFRREKGGPA